MKPLSPNPVPPGYKQTEVGVIPEDWEVCMLRKCLSAQPDYGINAPAVTFSDRLPTYVRITDITEEGKFSSEKPVSVKRADTNAYYLRDGDIVFARTGASVGKSYLYNTNDGKFVFAGFLIRVRPDADKLLPSFLSAYVTTGVYWNWVRLMSMRSGQPGINGNEYGQLPVPVPPLPEQHAIAAALSDVDALIGALDQLIAKKRDLKHGAMQELLTGKKRLPGFKGEWAMKSLGDIGETLIGLTYKPTDVRSDGILVLRSSNVHDGALRFDDNVYVDTVVAERIMVRFGDILICVRNGSRDLIGKCALINERARGMTFGAFMAVFRTPFYEYVYQQFQSYVIKRQIHEHLGATINQITNRSLNSFSIPLPPLPEQTAIAAVLSDMDAEIAALEQRRDKTRDLKQGMMQELLTGRTRLV